MANPARVLVVVILVLAVGAVALSAQQPKKDAAPAYLFSWLLGFGSGHFYLNDPGAVRFLVLDILSYGATIGGYVVMYSALYDPYADFDAAMSRIYIGGGIAIGGAILLAAARIWEIIDIFRAVNEQRAAGQVVMRPAVEIRRDDVSVALSFSY
jgi:TM2 domain-containing membrane protein YozV